MDALLTFMIAAAAAWLGVYAIRRWATRRQVFDRPNARSMHAVPTPTGGGLAIVVVFSLGLLVHVAITDGPTLAVLAFAGGAMLIAAVSWIDDIRPLRISVRLSAHMLAAVALLCACSAYRWQFDLPSAGMGLSAGIGGLILAVAFFWLVGMTNAYNFMDGVDGMAAGVAVVVGLSWFALATLCGATLAGMLGLLLAAAGGGFLLHNRPPARIFMGDVGSAFLGFSFGSLALIGAMADRRLAVAGVLLLWPFIFDTLSTFTRRLARGENVLAAHRQHLYQRLCLAGWTHGSVAIFYAFLASTGTLLAAAMLFHPAAGYWTAAVILPLLIVALWTFGQFQTTAWDHEIPPAETRTTPTKHPPEGFWEVKVRPAGQAVPQYPIQPGEQPKGE